MNVGRMVPATVLGLGALTAAVGVVTFAIGDEPDYADLSPAPDAVVWRGNEETTVWLEANRRDVELRIDGVALGLGNLKRSSEDGETVLGRSLGCEEWAVSYLTADNVAEDGAGFRVRGDAVGDFSGTNVQLRYREGAEPWPTPTLVTAAAAWTHALSGLDAGKTWEVEASSSDEFPKSLTRSITVDTSVETVTEDRAAQEMSLLVGYGVGLVACAVADDVLVTLHGDEGAELNRYLADVGAAAAAPAATPAAPVNRGNTTLQLCVDADASRADYLSGAESVGAAFSASDFGLSGSPDYTLADAVDGSGHAYFFSLNSGQLTVTGAGAGDTAGLDADRVYSVRITATDADGDSAYLDVGVWLDTSTVSNPDGDVSTVDGDGSCS